MKIKVTKAANDDENSPPGKEYGPKKKGKSSSKTIEYFGGQSAYIFMMKIVDIKFLGGKKGMKLIAFRRKLETFQGGTASVAGGGNSSSNPTLALPDQ